MPTLADVIVLAPEVASAIRGGAPVVALESALITHGLPYPKNAEVARNLETCVRQGHAIPATIAVLDGRISIGLSADELLVLARAKERMKVSRRDLVGAVTSKACGGTTVSATMFVAAQHGIKVFATGGIGGVHRESPTDISADLSSLADTPIIVVCAGAKAILDLQATAEYLETAGVAVIGYQTEEFPAFYSRESGIKLGSRVDSAQEVARYWKIHRSLNLPGAILVANPIPEAEAIPRSEIEPIITEASRQATQQGIRGQEVTPFLLQQVATLTGNRSIRANEALLLNNVQLAAQIANAVSSLVDEEEVPR